MRSLLVTLLAASVCASACRGARSEAGLPPAAFDGPTPSVIGNDRGLWFLVTDGATDFTPFVSIGTDEQRELFYAIPKGSRTVRLMPLSPFAYGQLDAVRGSKVEASWLKTPAEAGSDLPDSVGWTTGSAAGSVEWAGKTPPDGTAVVLVAGSPPSDLDVSAWIMGTATLRGGNLVDAAIRQGASAPFAVLPDGEPSSKSMIVGTESVAIPSVEGYAVKKVDVGAIGARPSSFSHRPLALRSGVDVLVTQSAPDTVDLTLAHPVVRRNLALAVTDDPLTVSAGRIPLALRGYRSLVSGQTLTASSFLMHAGPRIGDNEHAGRMRALELLAVAGYVDWTRNALVADADGLDADVALYLARAHYFGGDGARAADFAARAFERFGAWASPAAELGKARALRLQAALAAERDEWERALERAALASKLFAENGDAMRAAETELLASTYALRARDAKRAVKGASLARSRFYHGHSPYHSALAEIALSDIYRQLGETEKASEMVRYAILRFEELGDPVGGNRARIAEARVSGAGSHSQTVRGLEIALEKARATNDVVGVLDAAASLIVVGGAQNSATAEYGLAIVEGLDRSDDPHLRERAHQALTILCGRGLAEALSSIEGAQPGHVASARSACATPGDPGDVMLSTLIAQGWTALSARELEKAEEIAARARSAVDETVRQNAPHQAAEAIFFASVVEHETETPGWELTAEEAVELLRNSVDPTRFAPLLGDLAGDFGARGQTWLAARLLEAGVGAAADQRQPDLRRELAMRRVELLHSAEEWDDVRVAIRNSEQIVQGAGAAGAPTLGRLYTFQADVFRRLGREADAKVADGKADAAIADSKPHAQVELSLLGAQLATDRGDLEGAEEHLARANGLERGLSDGLGDDPERRLLRARVAVARAELAQKRSDRARAAKAYESAIDALAGLESTEEVSRIRLRALSGAGETATAADVLDDAIRQLERLQASGEFPAMIPAATEALARLEISAGRPGRARKLLKNARHAGTAVATSARDAVCLEARAAGLSGRSDAVAELNRCAAKSTGAQALDAALLSVLVDPAKTTADRHRKARELVATHGGAVPKREQERLLLVSELATGSTRPDERSDERLEKQLERATQTGDSSKIAAAVTKFSEVLLKTGRAEQAKTLVDARSDAFHDASPESAGTLARLRTRALVGMLDPSAFDFASRALSETENFTPSDEAELLLTAATNAVVLGMWQLARTHLADAADRAVTARDRDLQRRIETFAERFEVPLPD